MKGTSPDGVRRRRRRLRRRRRRRRRRQRRRRQRKRRWRRRRREAKRTMRFWHVFKFWACPLFQGWKIKNVTFSKCRSSAISLLLSRASRDSCMSVSATSVQKKCCVTALNSRGSRRWCAALRNSCKLECGKAPLRRGKAVLWKSWSAGKAPSGAGKQFFGETEARESTPEARESISLEKLERGKAPLRRGKANPWKNWSAGKAP